MLQVDAVPAGARCSLLRCSHGLPSIHIESGRLTRRASNTSFVSTTMPHCAFLGGRTHKLVTADTVAAGTNTSGILAGTCERRACCTRRGTLPFDNTSVATGGFRAILTPLPTGRNAVTSLAVAATFYMHNFGKRKYQHSQKACPSKLLPGRYARTRRWR